MRDRPPSGALLPLLYASLAGKTSVYFGQLGGSAEGPGRLALAEHPGGAAGRHSLPENPYGARGPKRVWFQGSTELII